MRTLIEIWEEIWGDTIPDEEEHKRAFRLLEDILKKINKYEDKEFLTDAISQSRSLNIIIKKLYFEFAPIEKRNVENPLLINPRQLPEIDVKNSPDFMPRLDKEYTQALERNELQDRICKNCSGENNFIEDFDRFDNPILVCIEDDCNQQYRYDRETKYQLKVPIHWIGLSNEVYDWKKGDFENWVASQIDPFTNKEDLELIQYDDNGKKINHYWDNLDDQPQIAKRPQQVNDSELEVFNKEGHWYYWVNGFKTFRFHQSHKERNFDDEYGCKCGICSMDV